MSTEHNMIPIKKGDTYVATYQFYQDQCDQTPLDVSTYVFKLMAKDSSGNTIFTWNNSDFDQIDSYTRRVTLSPVTTATYTAGEFAFELQVTIGTAIYTWITGYVEVQSQITS